MAKKPNQKKAIPPPSAVEETPSEPKKTVKGYPFDAEIETYEKAATTADPALDKTGFLFKLNMLMPKLGIELDEKKLAWWLGKRNIDL